VKFTYFKRMASAATNAVMAVTVLTSVACAQDTVMFNYQGRVKVDNAPFNGQGQFKFAILSPNQQSTLWSNDSKSVDGSEPTSGVILPVSDGIFNVIIGANGLMDPINSTIFQNNEPLKLRTWFSDGVHGFQALSPDHNLINVNLISSQTGGNDFDIYVNGSTGDDNNSGLKIEEPKKTIQAAIDIVPSRVLANLTINIADGTYNEALTLFGLSIKPGKTLKIQGDADWTPSSGGLPSVVITGYDGTTTGSLGTLVSGVQCSGVELSGLCVEGSSGDGILLENGKYAVKNCVTRFNLGSGLLLTTQGSAEVTNLISDSNNINGISLNSQSRIRLYSSSARSNKNSGLFMVDSSTANLYVSGNFSNNTLNGLLVIGASQLGFDNAFHGVANNNKEYGVVAGWFSYIHNMSGHLTATGNFLQNTYSFKEGQINW